LAPFPECWQIDRLPDGGRDLEGDLFGMAYDLGGEVNDCAAQGSGIGGERHHSFADILLECLVEEEAEEHGVVEGSIGGKALEGQGLGGELLQRPVDQFIPTPPDGNMR